VRPKGPALRGRVARALRQDGHEVVTAGDGAEAIDLLAMRMSVSQLEGSPLA
jgi:hypothetical protein